MEYNAKFDILLRSTLSSQQLIKLSILLDRPAAQPRLAQTPRAQRSAPDLQTSQHLPAPTGPHRLLAVAPAAAQTRSLQQQGPAPPSKCSNKSPRVYLVTKSIR